MSDPLDQMKDRLDRLLETQVEIRISLQEHMRRTLAAEARLEAVEGPVRELASMVPDLKKVIRLCWALMGLAAAGAVSGSAAGPLGKVLGALTTSP